jgi:hypothetical protein
MRSFAAMRSACAAVKSLSRESVSIGRD